MGFVFFVLAALNVLEVLCAVKGWSSIGFRLQQWSGRRRNFWSVGFLLAALWTLNAHFFLNPLPKAEAEEKRQQAENLERQSQGLPVANRAAR